MENYLFQPQIPNKMKKTYNHTRHSYSGFSKCFTLIMSTNNLEITLENGLSSKVSEYLSNSDATSSLVGLDIVKMNVKMLLNK